MTDCDVIVIGAGASGLMAARELSKKNIKVIVLEARNRTGGRIYTLEDSGFDKPAEAGAEFIHGNLPVTVDILDEAGLSYQKIEGNTYQSLGGEFTSALNNPEHEKLAMECLNALEEDVDVATFLDKYFDDDTYSGLVESIRGYVEGYDAADPSRASAFALRDEWNGDNATAGDQYRVVGGYGKLIRFLERKCTEANCIIHLSTVVQSVKWSKDRVEVTTGSQQTFTCKKLVVTIPLGLLQSGPDIYGTIRFSPALPDTFRAFQSLGFGNVIKILLQFKEPFWENMALAEGTNIELENMGWLFTDAAVPTWWTQLPEQTSLLTGWVAGPTAALWRDKHEQSILHEAFASLSAIFKIKQEDLAHLLSHWKIINWSADPFTRGAYAYSTLHTTDSIRFLKEPVEGTLFFAGEALHDGPEMGTVEGALTSGKMAAKLVTERLT